MSMRASAAGQCDICLLPSRRLRRIGDYSILGRTDCRHLFVKDAAVTSDHSELYSDAYFSDGGAGYVDYIAQAPQLIARGKRYARIATRYAGGTGRCFDVGAAAGFTLEGFRRTGWQVSGVEINGTMAHYANVSLGIPVRTGSVQSAADLGDIDCVTLLQVLEHLGHPVQIAEQLHHMLADGGIVIVETWNMRSLPAVIIGDAWHQWSPPTVRHWYTPASLTRLFSRAGFTLVQTGRPYKAVSLANGVSLLRSKLAPKRAMPLLDAFEHSAARHISIPYPPLDVFWAVFRKR